MQPVPEATWLVEYNEYHEAVRARELPPHTDPRMVMIEEMARSIGEGWEVEELPGTIPLYFCRRAGERHQVVIQRVHPDAPMFRPEPGAWSR